MKAVFFDLDGVLTRGFVIVDFWNHLSEKGLMDGYQLDRNEKNFNNYLGGKISYRRFASNGLKCIALAYKGQNQKIIESEARKYLRKKRLEMFPYTLPLVKMLKRRGYRTVAISGSDMVLVNNYRDIMGLDEVFGTEHEISGGIYTGRLKINMALKESKKATISRYSKKKNIDLEQSFGFGDSDQDVAILEKVGIPIALNPTKKLRRIAENRGWLVLTEKDNVVESVRELI